jgi:hypothetical protein
VFSLVNPCAQQISIAALQASRFRMAFEKYYLTILSLAASTTGFTAILGVSEELDYELQPPIVCLQY